MNAYGWTLLGLGAIEGLSAVGRFEDRTRLYKEAYDRAAKLSRPLVVIGAPRAGFHTKLIEAYGCGDVCIDLSPCACPVSIAADITKGPIQQIKPNSAVVFVSCVLEYVTDPKAAWDEVLRMAGAPENAFLVTVNPLSVTATLYPGARWMIRREGPVIRATPVTLTRRAVYAGGIGTLAYRAVRG